MEIAPIPRNEEARLNELQEYQVLDTIPERVYDDLTQIASLICQTPIALMSLIDKDRQWFKARLGLATPATSRDVAFCAHAILDPGKVMEVPDAMSDNRFSDNPLVIGQPNIRFYAGAPLVTETGEALGTLCVIDHAPGRLNDAQRTALQALARQAVDQLTLRREMIRLECAILERDRLATGAERYLRELEATVAALRDESATDSLTQLWDKTTFMHRLDQTFQGAHRSPMQPLSLLMLDVDNFKEYNDSYGYQIGDEALRTMAQVLCEQLRARDIIARYGGDEFSVILPATGEDGGLVLAERVRRAVERATWPRRQVTVTVGVSTSRPDDTPIAFLKRAEDALLRAKTQGRNRTWNGARRRVFEALLTDLRHGRIV